MLYKCRMIKWMMSSNPSAKEVQLIICRIGSKNQKVSNGLHIYEKSLTFAIKDDRFGPLDLAKDCTRTSCKKHKTQHSSWTSQRLRKIWL